MRAQESWVLWDLTMLLPPPDLGFPFGKSVTGRLAAKNASWTTYVLSLILETKKMSDKRFLRHTCTRTGRLGGKGSNKMWRLKGGRTDSSLFDRPEKGGIGLTEKAGLWSTWSMCKSVRNWRQWLSLWNGNEVRRPSKKTREKLFLRHRPPDLFPKSVRPRPVPISKLMKKEVYFYERIKQSLWTTGYQANSKLRCTILKTWYSSEHELEDWDPSRHVPPDSQKSTRLLPARLDSRRIWGIWVSFFQRKDI